MRDDTLNDEDGRLAALRRYELLDTGDEEPFRRIVELIQDVLDVPMAGVSLIDQSRQWFKAARGLPGTELPRSIAFCDLTIRQPGPLAIPDATLDPRFAANPLVTGAPHIRSYLGVPLTTPDGYNIGTLCAFDTEKRPFDARQAGILQKLAQIVIEQCELRQIAKQDAMTGALTRGGFFAEVEKEFTRANRYERPSALVLIDVDRFRVLNDRFGHLAGDSVLVTIANTCMAMMRKSDVFGRIGGGEFGLLLPETSGEDARDAADRIRRAIEETTVETQAASIKVTVSCGVAPIPAKSETAATWLNEADIALYEAKQFGRNRVVASRQRKPLPSPTDLDHQLARPH